MKMDELTNQSAVIDRQTQDMEASNVTTSGPRPKSRINKALAEANYVDQQDYTVLNGTLEPIESNRFDTDRWSVYLLSRDYPWMSADYYSDGHLADSLSVRLHSLESSFATTTLVPDSVIEDTAVSAHISRYERMSGIVDVIGSALLILALAPIFLLVAATIYFMSGRPILFQQQRVGKDGKLFTCYKFRTMRTNAEELKASLMDESHHSDTKTFKMRRDPRVTVEGEIFRKLSIDELPQLWNVFCGDMALVGPRPAVPSEVAQYNNRDRERLKVKPGLTCIWQISGRGDVPFHQQVEMDIDYIENRSLILDLKILVMTLPAVIFCRGAY